MKDKEVRISLKTFLFFKMKRVDDTLLMMYNEHSYTYYKYKKGL